MSRAFMTTSDTAAVSDAGVSEVTTCPSVRADLASLFHRGWRRWIVVAIVLLGLAVRVPGVFWGTNFPLDDFTVHHPDEFSQTAHVGRLLRAGDSTVRLPTYPRGTAAPVAATLQAVRAATRTTAAPQPSRETIAMAGRSVSVLYGAMTVVVLLLLAQRFLVQWPSVVAAGVATALGGLLVTQSHFFVADAPALFWFTLALYLLRLHLDDQSRMDVEHLQWSAFAFGAAFGTKLVIVGLPSLAIAALLPGPRVRRAAGAAIFFAAGFGIITAFSFSPHELWKTLGGVTAGYVVLDRTKAALMYLLQFPAVFGLPVAILAAVGSVTFARRDPTLFRRSPFRLEPILTVWMPLALAMYVILLRVDPFPRHLLMLFPWVALFAGAGFSLTQNRLRQLGVPAFVLPALATGWLALFVFDGERHFITDPRNRAGAWVLENVPRGADASWHYHSLKEYSNVNYSHGGTPEVIVAEMLFANDFLSGQGRRNSMPTDFREVFIGQNQERMLRMQSLFTGGNGYHEVARFSEDYFMPELTVPLRLVGDRSRSYITEVVIFQRDSATTPNPQAIR
jgi:hypothetical protein